MGNLPCLFKNENDESWTRQNKEKANPVYRFAKLGEGGSLVKAYKEHRLQEELIKMSEFFYHPDGSKHTIELDEFKHWKRERQKNCKGDQAEYERDQFEFHQHDACWDLSKRGGVGETPFHLLYIKGTDEDIECANIVLKTFPNLALDIYEGDEYYGESALHIAIVKGDFKSVDNLVNAGADINQRATGRFFLPKDQKQKFNSRDTNYDGDVYYGEYPLAFAAYFGKTDVYDLLLQKGADPNKEDSFGNTVLHMVVIANQPQSLYTAHNIGPTKDLIYNNNHLSTNMYRYAVRHHQKKAKTTLKNKMSLTPMLLACKLGRHTMFKEILDLDSIEHWSFGKTMCSCFPLRTLDSIGPQGDINFNSALMIILDGETDEHLEMLDGVVMRQLIDAKWKCFAKKLFSVRMALTILNLIMLTIAIWMRPSGPDLLSCSSYKDPIRYAAEILVCLNLALPMHFALNGIYHNTVVCFFKLCIKNPVLCCSNLHGLCVFVCILFRFTRFDKAEDGMLMAAAPLAWLFLLFFIGIWKSFGPMITMIWEMCTGDLVRFSLVYLVAMFSFYFGFSFLFQEGEEEETKSLQETLLTMFQMTFGEFNSTSLSKSRHPPLTKIIFAVFMVVVAILLFNKLIAMMTKTYTRVISKSEKQWRKRRAKTMLLLELGLTKNRRLKYQQLYSKDIKEASTAEDGNEAQRGGRGLMVIEQRAKSRAQMRRTAVNNWKILCKEVIEQLRKHKHDKPFQLQESQISQRRSPKRGRGKTVLSTVSKIASLIDDPNSISSMSQTLSGGTGSANLSKVTKLPSPIVHDSPNLEVMTQRSDLSRSTRGSKLVSRLPSTTEESLELSDALPMKQSKDVRISIDDEPSQTMDNLEIPSLADNSFSTKL